MATLDRKIESSEKWKRAKKELKAFEELMKKFEESMKLIKQYSIKPLEKKVYSTPYQIPQCFCYN